MSAGEWTIVEDKPGSETIGTHEYQCADIGSDRWWPKAYPCTEAEWDFDNYRYRIRRIVSTKEQP